MGNLCSKFGKNRSTNYVTFLSTDAGRTDGRKDVYVILYSVQCICIALDRQLAQCLRSPHAKFQRSSAKGTFSNLGSNRGGVGKIDDFQPISRRISETVRDRAKVTIDD